MESQDITVIKLNPEEQETWRYSGRVLERTPDSIRLEALFNRKDTPFLEIVLRKGDRFVETYYSGRWYNIYEIFDVLSGESKGWYCNVTRPARIEHDFVYYVDLALDLWVYPDGRQVVLDEDEFAELKLTPEETERAWKALGELQELFRRHD
jgi:uncharacterized protein